MNPTHLENKPCGCVWSITEGTDGESLVTECDHHKFMNMEFLRHQKMMGQLEEILKGTMTLVAERDSYKTAYEQIDAAFAAQLRLLEDAFNRGFIKLSSVQLPNGFLGFEIIP